MKLNKQQLKDFILKEVKSVLAESSEEPVTQSVEEEIIKENNSKEKIETEEIEKVEISEVKNLAEEFKRMKELIDFRSPLLFKD